MTDGLGHPLGTPENRDINLTAEQAGRLLNGACGFQADRIQARERCREDFRRAEREDGNTLSILIDGQLAAIDTKMVRPISKVDPAVSYQIGLVTSYIRTHFVVTDLILNGDLIEAATLVRKQLESIARLHELDHKPIEKLHGRTPNVGQFFRHGGGEMYGTLSEVAHFSKPRVSEFMRVIQDGERIGPSLHPVFAELSFACLDMHHFVSIYFLGWITEKLSEWYPELDHSENQTLLYMTIALAQRIDVIRLPDKAEES